MFYTFRVGGFESARFPTLAQAFAALQDYARNDRRTFLIDVDDEWVQEHEGRPIRGARHWEVIGVLGQASVELWTYNEPARTYNEPATTTTSLTSSSNISSTTLSTSSSSNISSSSQRTVSTMYLPIPIPSNSVLYTFQIRGVIPESQRYPSLTQTFQEMIATARRLPRNIRRANFLISTPVPIEQWLENNEGQHVPMRNTTIGFLGQAAVEIKSYDVTVLATSLTSKRTREEDESVYQSPSTQKSFDYGIVKLMNEILQILLLDENVVAYMNNHASSRFSSSKSSSSPDKIRTEITNKFIQEKETFKAIVKNAKSEEDIIQYLNEKGSVFASEMTSDVWQKILYRKIERLVYMLFYSSRSFQSTLNTNTGSLLTTTTTLSTSTTLSTTSSTSLNRNLLDAIKINDVDEVYRILADPSSDPVGKDNELDEIPLHVAVQNQRWTILEALLEDRRFVRASASLTTDFVAFYFQKPILEAQKTETINSTISSYLNAQLLEILIRDGRVDLSVGDNYLLIAAIDSIDKEEDFLPIMKALVSDPRVVLQIRNSDNLYSLIALFRKNFSQAVQVLLDDYEDLFSEEEIITAFVEAWEADNSSPEMIAVILDNLRTEDQETLSVRFLRAKKSIPFDPVTIDFQESVLDNVTFDVWNEGDIAYIVNNNRNNPFALETLQNLFNIPIMSENPNLPIRDPTTRETIVRVTKIRVHYLPSATNSNLQGGAVRRSALTVVGSKPNRKLYKYQTLYAYEKNGKFIRA